MNFEFIIEALQQNRQVFNEMLKHVPKEQYLWKPDADKWCLLEVTAHLYDEEREDFRARLNHVLQNPELPLPQIDPEGWVKSRNYLNKNFAEVLEVFLEERQHSVEWLKQLESPNWENAYQHPRFGPMTAEMFLVNWLAHDYLHIRQVTRLKYQYLKHISKEELFYAGEW